jgi:parallel beta-helix repeat protein
MGSGVASKCANSRNLVASNYDPPSTRRARPFTLLIAISMFLPSFLLPTGIASAATHSPPVIVAGYTLGEGQWLNDGDLYRGANYLYAFTNSYNQGVNPAYHEDLVYIKRSTDGVTWSGMINIWSALYCPHGGFCVYTVGGIDHLIASALGSVKKSSDNGNTFSSLTPLSSSLDYTGVATNMSMDPSKSYDSDIYVAGSTGTNGIYLKKSVDGGASWSSSITITDIKSYAPLFMRDALKLYCFYRYDVGSEYNVYVKNSTDWGKTWGAQKLVYSKTQSYACPGHAQYIDEQKCLLTISDCSSSAYNKSRGVYGYFWFSNSTFQQIGYETGSEYNNNNFHSYSGVVNRDADGVNYTSLWAYYTPDPRIMPPGAAIDWWIMTHFSRDSNISLASKYAPHNAISINGDAGFTNASGVVGGKGTSSDPYIIRNWEINSSSSIGITIKNTNAYFILRDIFVSSVSKTYAGIFMTNVKNGTIKNTYVYGNSYGIYLSCCDNINVSGGELSSNSLSGICLILCSDITIGCRIASNGYNGMDLRYCSNARLANCTVSSNGWNGIYTKSCPNITIAGGFDVSDNNYCGIYFVSSNDACIGDIISSHNRRSGIFIGVCDGTTISNSKVNYNSWYGVNAVLSTNTTVTGCDLRYNGYGNKY